MQWLCLLIWLFTYLSHLSEINPFRVQICRWSQGHAKAFSQNSYYYENYKNLMIGFIQFHTIQTNNMFSVKWLSAYVWPNGWHWKFNVRLLVCYLLSHKKNQSWQNGRRCSSFYQTLFTYWSLASGAPMPSLTTFHTLKPSILVLLTYDRGGTLKFSYKHFSHRYATISVGSSR